MIGKSNGLKIQRKNLGNIVDNLGNEKGTMTNLQSLSD